jgi:rifampicin phosphotransferase
MNIIKEFKDIRKNDVSIAGGKGASLGEMTNTQIPIPNGFVILSRAFEEFIKEADLNVEIDAILDTVKHNEIHTVEQASEKIQALILTSHISDQTKKAILNSFNKLNTKYVAVRSSATSEDSADAAWAGQLESYLNTTKDNLIENVKKCWASLFNPRAIFYRFEKELNKEKISVAVVVQKMVESESSGIAFSVHPVTQDPNQLIIEAGFGLGEAIVSGQITPDSYVVDKEDWHIIDIKINKQQKGLFKRENGGNEWKELKEKGAEQVLNKKEIIELSKLIIKIEKHYGFPVDIEWARKNGKFYITQSRPITTLSEVNQKPKTLLDKFMKGFHKDVFYPLVPVSILAAGAGGFTPNFGGKFKDLNIKFLIAMKEKKAFVLMSETRYNMLSENFFIKYNKNKKILSETISYLNNLEKKTDEIYSNLSYENIMSCKEKEIIKKLEKIINLVREYNCTAWFSTQFDKELVFKFINKHNLRLKSQTVEKIWNKAIVPMEDSFDKRKHKKILSLILQSKTTKEIAEEMQYAYSGYTQIKSVNDIEDNIKKEYSKYLNDIKKGAEELKKEELKYRKKKESFNEWRDSLSQDGKELLDYMQAILILRDKRKDVIGKGMVINFRIGEKFFKEVRLEKELIYYCAYEEFLKGKNYFEEKQEEILNRSKGVLFLHDYDGSIKFEYDNFEDIKEKMEEIYHKSQKKDEESISGQIAYKGNIKGKVKVILRPSEFNKFKKGDILVTSMTRPEFMPLMRKAKAIITDEGGITCHAAIISRELKIPCIIGTKIATKMLKNGNLIELDADKGIIKISKQNDPEEYTELLHLDLPLSLVELHYEQESAKKTPYSTEEFKIKPYIFYEKKGDAVYLFYSKKGIDWQMDKAGNYKPEKFALKSIKEKYDIIKDIIEKEKTLNKEEFIKFIEDVRNLWPWLNYMWWAIEYKEKNNKSFEELIKIRKYTEHFTPGIISVFKKSIKNIFPEKEKYANVILLTEIQDEKFPTNEVLDKRLKSYTYTNHKLYNSTEEIFDEYNISIEKVSNKLSGQSAYPGEVKGIVKIIKKREDMLNFKKGEILVSSTTTPDFLPAMKKAAAIISEHGGAICHAAITSRELKIPCIVGVKGATQILNNKDEIEVNANKGTIEIKNPKTSLGHYNNYQRCFQWKGGGLPFMISDLFMEHYKKLKCLIVLADGIWTNFLPKEIIEFTLNDGLERIKNTNKFDSYKQGFEDYKKECTTFFEKLLSKKEISKEEISQSFKHLSRLFYYYSKTEFFYMDKAFEYSKKHKETAKNLEKFDAIKNEGRAYLNKCYLGEESYLEKILKKLSKKFSIDINDLRAYNTNEIISLFDGNKVDIKLLGERKNSYIMQTTNNKVIFIEGEKAYKMANEFLHKSEDLNKSELKGIIANKGKIRGHVKKIEYGPGDFDKLKNMIEKMNKGDVLVADTTAPEIMMACKKASAILTNQGGLMSHAAIVSRELGIPCIVGLGNATEILNDGDLIEVNANKGVIKILEKNN